MNRLYKVLKTAVWCDRRVLGVTGYLLGLSRHPAVCAAIRTVVYEHQIHAVFTAVVVGVLLAGMWLKRRMK
ncbi:MAG: hypothetical protein ACLRNA_03865 [Gemmiger formicilis]|uniref:hypothetical protein n=1 Tax=Gemmiger formicilis TaxID=745368 RepID=UPI003A20A14D